MLILVPIKRVPDPYATVRPLADGSGLDLEGLKHDINPFDEIAMEEAVRKREADPAVKIVAVSIGSDECEEQLRKALAIGADQAILLLCDDPVDSWVAACELEALARELNPDLILMGKQATDADSCQTGQLLAAKLGWPQATFASKVDIEGSLLTVARETDEGEEIVQMNLPGVVTTDLRLNEPRYIALPGIIKARSKPLDKRDRLTEAMAKVSLIAASLPPAREPGRIVASVDELVGALKDRGVI
jgi:electron transfer flavoprotein beta subunit